MKSTAYITAAGIDYTYRFCGVTAIEYNFALNIDADTSQGGDIINGARRLPNQIRLSVLESDAEASPGWAASMLSALDSIRRNRLLCTVSTSLGAWGNLFLSEITATQDETHQTGWAGDLVFTQYIPRSEQFDLSAASGTAPAAPGNSSLSTLHSSLSSASVSPRTSNNSSTRVNTGTSAAAVSGTSGALSALLSRAGISGGPLFPD